MIKDDIKIIKIKDEDIKIIKNIALKYNLQITELCRYIIKQGKKSNQIQVRVNDEEFKIIKNKADDKEITMSQFCILACNYFIKNNYDFDVDDFRINKTNRNKRIAVTNHQEEVLMEVADKYSIKVSTLIRYCALNYDF